MGKVALYVYKPDFCRLFCVMIALVKRSSKHVLFLFRRNNLLQNSENKVNYHMLT
jgi:hypothetical protein